MADGCVVRNNYSGRITIKSDGQGNKEIKEEPLDAEALQRFKEMEASFTRVKENEKKKNSAGAAPHPGLAHLRLPPRPPRIPESG